ncbi:MAG: hypothetical protein FWH33_01245 [Oscillospiraceae bacterium]|nr:hypothetical protein [Oscillospiraceae bacterium]
MSKLENIKALRKTESIQELLDDAMEIMQNPIAMFDMNYSLIAYTEVETDDPVWNELISTGTFSMETQAFFADAYFTLNVSSADRIVVLKSELLKYDRVLAYVFNRDHIKVANLVMVACNNALMADDLVALNAFAEKLTAVVRNIDHYTEYGRNYHNDLIIKILEGVIKDTRLYAPHVQILYDGFDDNLYLAIINVGVGDSREEAITQIRDMLVEMYKSCKFAIYSGYIIMLISSKRDVFDVNKVFGKHDDFLRQYDLSIGVSSCFENLYILRKYYDEALAMLEHIDKDGVGVRVLQYDNFV